MLPNSLDVSANIRPGNEPDIFRSYNKGSEKKTWKSIKTCRKAESAKPYAIVMLRDQFVEFFCFYTFPAIELENASYVPMKGTGVSEDLTFARSFSP